MALLSFILCLSLEGCPNSYGTVSLPQRGDLIGLPSGNHLREFWEILTWLSTPILSLLLCNGNALFLALEDILTPQFSHSPKDGQHELAGRRGGIDSLLPGDELHALPCQLFY